MEDGTLLKLAFGVSLVGIVFLFLCYEGVSLELSDFEELESKNVDEYVKIVGEVERFNVNFGMYILEIGDGNTSFPVVVFAKKRINFVKGGRIIVEGKITEYKGKKEIIASRIEFL